MARSQSLPVQGPYPSVTGPQLKLVEIPDENKTETVTEDEDGSITIEHPDGSITIDTNPDRLDQDEEDDSDFDINLAKKIDESKLSAIATDLLEGVQRDIDSRKEWLETRAMGITLLGLKLEKPRSEVGGGAAPLEGMSTVRHPLLLEATVAFQATARAELLPAAGPVKVRNDTPMPPKKVMLSTTALTEYNATFSDKDELAQALETDMNHYLTAVATEYIPDTDRMLFYVGFGGDGFKKVYNCPLRRRPVSESVDAENLIVSNAATDLQNSGRITHHIKMRKSTMKRMQILGVYRDVDLGTPQIQTQTPVDQEKNEIAGFQPNQLRPEDRDYEIYEIYCELDLDAYAPEHFKGKGLPLPYRVTIEKESRQILDIRRNWKEDDKECHAKQFFVQFPFIRGIGFYGLGYIHILGNTTNALTAAWREMLDAGMFASFPGFIFAKGAGRQNTNQFRVPPGGGIPLDVGPQQDIRSAIMPLPYKEPGAGHVSFVTHVEEVGRRLASTANINVGEGKQDAPVGTTLALIEQASKVMDSAHKRLHAAQAEEFKLLKERFREDPEAFWRHNKKPAKDWQKEQFLAALDSCELVPVADPNNPTSLHRIAKAMTIKQLQQGNPQLYDPIAVDLRVLRTADIDPMGLFRPGGPAPTPPDPRMVAIEQKAKAQQMASQIDLLEAKIKAETAAAQLMDKEKDRQSRERIEQMHLQLQGLKLEQEHIIHAQDAERNRIELMQTVAQQHATHQQSLQQEALSHAHQSFRDHAQAQTDLHIENQKQKHNSILERERHDAEMRRAEEAHRMKLEHDKELHAARLEAAKQMAAVKPKKEGKK